MTAALTTLRMSAADIDRFLEQSFPQCGEFGARVERVDERGVAVGLDVHERHLRPGDTVSGPTLMTLADTAMYVAVLSRVGPRALAVTTDLNIHFLRRPVGSRLRADCRLLKLGRRLAVGEVHITCDDRPGPVAQATLTYALPPEHVTG